ncbi:MAG: hypothetical protein J1D88_06570 [Treponema sp.]|nr:hypothetical protein [Treponema sp.]
MTSSRKPFFACLFLFALFVVFPPYCSADSAATDSASTEAGEAEPYTKDEFPRWARDMRRTEIIIFGSMPFVTLGVTLAYGGYLYASGQTSSFPNPLDKTSEGFTTEQQFAILGIAGGISVALGLTDLLITLVRRKNAAKRLERLHEREGTIVVTPLTPEDAGAMLHGGKHTDDSPPESEKNAGSGDSGTGSAVDFPASGPEVGAR